MVILIRLVLKWKCKWYVTLILVIVLLHVNKMKNYHNVLYYIIHKWCVNSSWDLGMSCIIILCSYKSGSIVNILFLTYIWQSTFQVLQWVLKEGHIQFLHFVPLKQKAMSLCHCKGYSEDFGIRRFGIRRLEVLGG